MVLFSLCLIGRSCHFKDRWCDYRKWLFFFPPLAGAQLKPLIALGLFSSNRDFLCFFFVFSPHHRHCLRYPFITQMRRSRRLLTTPGSDGAARRSVTRLLTGGWDSDCHLCFTCRPRRLPEDACKAIIVCALVDPVNNWLYWLSATAPQRDREGETGEKEGGVELQSL